MVVCSNCCPLCICGDEVLAASAVRSFRVTRVRGSIAQMGVPVGSGGYISREGRDPVGGLLRIFVGWATEPTRIEKRGSDQVCSYSKLCIRLSRGFESEQPIHSGWTGGVKDVLPVCACCIHLSLYDQITGTAI